MGKVSVHERHPADVAALVADGPRLEARCCLDLVRVRFRAPEPFGNGGEQARDVVRNLRVQLGFPFGHFGLRPFSHHATTWKGPSEGTDVKRS